MRLRWKTAGEAAPAPGAPCFPFDTSDPVEQGRARTLKGTFVAHLLIIGGAGMIGQRVAAALAGAGPTAVGDITKLTLSDVVPAQVPALPGIAATARVDDLSEPGTAERLIADRPDAIVHLAAIVSGEAEADFEKGYRINLDGTRNLFEAVRRANQASDGAYKPRLVFTSSIAAFGAPFPEAIDDDFAPAPLTSYGTQKVIGELLLADYTRRGFFDGIGLRLPTICVRPGKPNKAASGLFSNIIREPLAGKEAVLPVSEDARHWFASPRSAVGFILHALKIDTAPIGQRRTLSMPGLSATIGDELAALERAAGPQALKLIRREHDPLIAKIVAGWPTRFTATRALALGFTAESSFDEIVRAHIEDSAA
jgi:nucleoside-diphosphate-sugar epimerase